MRPHGSCGKSTHTSTAIGMDCSVVLWIGRSVSSSVGVGGLDESNSIWTQFVPVSLPYVSAGSRQSLAQAHVDRLHASQVQRNIEQKRDGGTEGQTDGRMDRQSDSQKARERIPD